MRMGIHASLAVLTALLPAVAGFAQDDPPPVDGDPPAVETPAPAPTPAPIPKMVIPPKTTSIVKAPPRKPTTARTSATPIVYQSRYGGASASPTASTQNFMALKRSARSKTYIPNLMENALNWSRVSPTTTSAWNRKGGWSSKDKWDAPSTWKGAGLDKTATSLTKTRSPGLSYAERHPLQASFGARKPVGKK